MHLENHLLGRPPCLCAKPIAFLTPWCLFCISPHHRNVTFHSSSERVREATEMEYHDAAIGGPFRGPCRNITNSAKGFEHFNIISTLRPAINEREQLLFRWCRASSATFGTNNSLAKTSPQNIARRVERVCHVNVSFEVLVPGFVMLCRKYLWYSQFFHVKIPVLAKVVVDSKEIQFAGNNRRRKSLAETRDKVRS